MLTRLRVSGFKNLVDADVRFGPFTCVAGANGVGKSNLFDAIHFLKLLTQVELVEAARSIRDERGKTGEVRGLFTKAGNGHVDRMTFEVEMITPKSGIDRLRQPVEATSTLLSYRLELGYRGEDSPSGPLEIVEEELSYITKSDAPDAVLFPHSAASWRDRVVVAKRKTGKPYIQTRLEHDRRVVAIHQDGNAGRAQLRLAEPLPRTVLSSLNAFDAPTAVVARNEIESWRLLQFEPTSLRRPDDFRSPTDVASDGSHLPAALYRLIGNGEPDAARTAIRQRIANRLSDLVDDVRDVRVDRDEKRELLTVVARLRDGTEHPARSLSDGTLRFLALAIIEQKADAGGVFCLEEPENGIHPERIPAMLQLLKDIAVNPKEEAGDDNPLRQVIINTHSPIVVGEVPDDSVVLARSVSIPATINGGAATTSVVFEALPETWRTDKAGARPCSLGRLLSYLNPLQAHAAGEPQNAGRRGKRVMDREDMQPLLPFASAVGENGH